MAEISKSKISHQIYLLLPSKMMEYPNMIDSISFGPYILMPAFAIAVSVLLIPFSYKASKYHQEE